MIYDKEFMRINGHLIGMTGVVNGKIMMNGGRLSRRDT